MPRRSTTAFLIVSSLSPISGQIGVVTVGTCSRLGARMPGGALNVALLVTPTARTLYRTSVVCLWKPQTSFCDSGGSSTSLGADGQPHHSRGRRLSTNNHPRDHSCLNRKRWNH